MENEPKKFLKNEALFINEIASLYDQKDYEHIGARRNEVFNNIEFYKKTDVIQKIASSLFFGRYFTECVTFIEELRKNEIEDMIYSFYMLACLISEDDIFMARSYLKRSKLMNSSKVLAYIEEDGANYSNILNVEDENDIPCLLLVNYINEYDKEGIDNNLDIKDIRIFKYYDMIDNIYGFGYESVVVEYMINVGRLLFEK